MLRVLVVLVLLALGIVATQGGFQTGGGRHRKFRRWGWLGKVTTSAKPHHARQFAAATTSTTISWSQKSTSTTTIHSGRSRGPLLVELQQCRTPNELLQRVGRHVSHANDPDGSLASQVLVRWSKLCIARHNHQQHHHPSTSSDLSQQQQQQQHEVTPLAEGDLLGNADDAKVLNVLTEHLASRPIILLGGNSDRSNLEVLVDGTKACAIVARLTSSLTTTPDLLPSCCWWEPVIRMWQQHNDNILPKIWQEHQISGLHWALESLQVVSANPCPLPASIQRAYDELNLPFRIYPGLLLLQQQEGLLLPVDDWINQVEHWGADEIRVGTTRVVPERRYTAWQGDDGVAPFAYSGKHMIRRPWSRPVRQVRDRLFATTSQYYNACLLNWYPDGQSGMRYHSDPDQGILWDYDTVVVSVGATRRFAFRPNRSNSNVTSAASPPPPPPPHNFVVLHGDVTHMWGDCQERFQHAVKNADEKQETAPRVSLVFKRSWGWCESSQSSSDESNNV